MLTQLSSFIRLSYNRVSWKIDLQGDMAASSVTDFPFFVVVERMPRQETLHVSENDRCITQVPCFRTFSRTMSQFLWGAFNGKHASTLLKAIYIL